MVATLLSLFAALNTNMTSSTERTFLMVKHDGVQRGLVGEIIQRFEKKGFKLVAMKMMKPSRKLVSEHYAEHKERGFYETLVSSLADKTVVPMVWEGDGVIASSRLMIGATNPLLSNPGSIRGDLAVSIGKNLIHGSDGTDASKREIDLWFQTNEITSYEATRHCDLYE